MNLSRHILDWDNITLEQYSISHPYIFLYNLILFFIILVIRLFIVRIMNEYHSFFLCKKLNFDYDRKRCSRKLNCVSEAPFLFLCSHFLSANG